MKAQDPSSWDDLQKLCRKCQSAYHVQYLKRKAIMALTIMADDAK